MGVEQSKGRGPRESVGSPAMGESQGHPGEARTAEAVAEVHAPGQIDTAVHAAAQAIVASGQLLPGGGCYLIAYDKTRFPAATMARVVDYLAAMDIQAILLACRGDVSGAIQVVPTEELDR